MKKKNCNCEYIDSRNSQLRKEFLLRLNNEIKNLNELFEELSRIPAPRFFISEERAYNMLKERLRLGRWKSGMLPSRLCMIKEIACRVVVEMESNYRLTLKSAVFKVVNSPAPTYYLSPGSIRTIVYDNLKKRNYEN